jgi:uncharacterized repeat protein (TIGR03803 family)
MMFLFFAVLMFGAAIQVSAQREKTIYVLHGSPDGDFPQAPVIADKAGNLYGNAYEGGAFGFGMTFELSPPAVSGGAWTETDLHDFTGGTDGGGPIGPLALDAAGNLYGVANFGATGNVGLIFELSPPATQGSAWTQTVVAGADISSSGVTMDSKGNLYWVNGFGGLVLSQCAGFFSGCGSVYEAMPPATSGGSWTSVDLYDFGTNGGANDPRQPIYGLSVSRSGALYGEAAGGGTNGFGAVYKLTPPATSGGAWTETVIYNFKGGTTDGSQPVGAMFIGSNGTLYGATEVGGPSGDGTVYQITPPSSGSGWKESLIYNFTGKTDGGLPIAGLVGDAAGNLYGTTDLFGTTCRISNVGCGTVYKLAPPTVSGGSWTETTLHIFTATNNDGANPVAPLTFFNGTLFGTTGKGGTIPGLGYGTVFELGTK